jgi:hypothetical protein
VIPIAKKIIYIGVLLLLIVLCLYLLSPRDNGPGVNAVRTDIQSVGEQQSTVIEQLGAVERRIEASEGQLRTSSELIREGKSILATVRARGQKGN